jgi:hypothetical protein
MTTAQDLRRVIGEIRRKPYPISDLIPLLDRAATELEKKKDECPCRYLPSIPK